MPVTWESCPSTSATYSCSSRSESLCLAACRMTLAIEERGQPSQSVFERNRGREAEAIAHRGIGGVKLDVLFGVALMPNRHVDAERPRHRLDDGIDAGWRARGEI